MPDPMLCQSLYAQLATFQAKLKNDTNSLKDLNAQINLAKATLANNDPGFPEWTVLAISARIAQLMAQPSTPETVALVGQYNVLLMMMATVATWQLTIASDQATIAGIQQQITNAGC